jgi:hypothetical protein
MFQIIHLIIRGVFYIFYRDDTMLVTPLIFCLASIPSGNKDEVYSECFGAV